MMIAAGLDLFVDRLDAALSVDVTRDPGAVVPPCVFVDIPAITGRTMGATVIAVPVHLIVPAPGDLYAADTLLGIIPDVLDVCGSNEASPGTYAPGGGDVSYPCITTTATITIQRGN